MQHEDIDYRAAAIELRALLTTLNLTFAAEPMLGSDCSEDGKQRFAFILSDEQRREIRGEWSCGSAVALREFIREPFKIRGLSQGRSEFLRAARVYGRVSLHDDRARRDIREAFRPGVFDVVSSLLSEVSCVDGYSDWTDWAEDMGMFSDRASADDVRKAIADFAVIKTRAPILRAMFGRHFDRAIFLAGSL